MQREQTSKILMLWCLLSATGLMLFCGLYLVLFKTPMQKAQAYYALSLSSEDARSQVLLRSIELYPFFKPSWKKLTADLNAQGQAPLARDAEAISTFLKEPLPEDQP